MKGLTEACAVRRCNRGEQWYEGVCLIQIKSLRCRFGATIIGVVPIGVDVAAPVVGGWITAIFQFYCIMSMATCLHIRSAQNSW